MEYQRHPQSEVFPAMSKDEFAALVASIRSHGFDQNYPVMLFEKQIVDGWHRYKAAIEVGVEPRFKQWQGSKGKLLDYIIYSNSTRRHLSKAAHAQALLKANALSERMNSKDIASIAGVSVSTVNEQKRIREINPALADKVASGEEKATAIRRQVLGKDKGERSEYRYNYLMSKRQTKFVLEKIHRTQMTIDRYISNVIDEHMKRSMLKK